MRVLGVDPGSAATGYGIVERHAGRYEYLTAGVIRGNRRLSFGGKLLNIHETLCGLISDYLPAAMSLERSFVAANVQSAFRIGEVRAVALLAAARFRLPLFEYAPAQVKLAVAAHGQAAKAQVKLMVRRTLDLDAELELADDAADALALALCHLGQARLAGAAKVWRS